MKICPVGSKCGRTDVTKLTVTFRTLTNASKNVQWY